ncbi:MAG: aldo/keto reductase [Chloroflexi bacterium]|nr:aldo/keto reductase [Chloroflexota bacterium]
MLGTDQLTNWEDAAAFRLLDAVYEQGCRVLDTAHVYGDGANERRVGRWLKARGRREEMVILAKGAHHSEQRRRVTPADITADLSDSLARFQTEQLDLYLLHRDDPRQPVGPIVECLHEHAEAGRIGAYGGSNWTTARLQEANDYAAANGLRPFVAGSPNFSLAEQFDAPWPGCVSVSGDGRACDLAWYRDAGVALFAWSSLAGGFFSGRVDVADAKKRPAATADGEEGWRERCLRVYGHERNWRRQARARDLAAAKGLSLAQVALAYVLSQEGAVFPLVGCQSGAEFAECVAALAVKLTAAELRWLEED